MILKEITKNITILMLSLLVLACFSNNSETFTVAFETNGGNILATLTDIKSGTKISEPASPIKTGYIFSGWHKDSTLNTTWDFNIDTVDDNITLYAKWREKDPVIQPSNAIYVSITGSDSTGDGSFENPYKTLQFALDSDEVIPGSTVILRGGTYKSYTDIRIRKQNITIKSMDGEWAIIETPNTPVDLNGDPVHIYYCDNAVALSFRIEWHGDDLTGDNSSGCTLQRLEIKGGAYYCIKFETTWDWDYNVPYNKRYGVSNVLIEDCIIHDSGYDCIKITEKCNNITIRNTEIYNSGMAYPPGTSHDDKNSEGIDNVQGHSLLVEDCYIHDIATTGVYFKGGAMNCIIQRTKVERCGNSGILLGFDTSPEYFNLETNPDYYENINGTVRNCLVIDTNYEGIGLYASKDAHVYNNTLVNVGKNGVHSAIYLGVATQDWDENAKRPPNINPSIYNNIVKQSKGVNNLMVAIRYSQDLGGLSGLSGKANIDNNLYYIDGEHALFIDSRPAFETEKITLKDWANHIDGDKLSFEEDPLLDSEYRQIKNSPCIDKGKNIPSFEDDFDKKTRDSKFDIGCYEF